MAMATEEEIRYGLTGNSFLIWEMLDDSINSICGTYHRMGFWEGLRGEKCNHNLKELYSMKRQSIRKLSYDLANAEESVLIDKVVELWREYEQVKAVEAKEYSNDSASYLAKYAVSL